jgi:hypothetical protein
MSNPAQPSFVWQLYSYDLEPNSSLFASRLACEPVHIQMNEDDWHVMVVNNLPTPLKGARATILVVNLDGTVNSRGEASLTAAPCAATDIGAVAWKPGLSPVHFVRLELRDSQNRLVSENFYWRSLPEHPDDFQDLNRLKEVTLDASVARHDAGGLCLLELTLANPTKGVALMAHVQLRGARSGQRILPVYYTGNYVSLLPGESRSVGIEASQADLKGDDPLVVVDGWNTTVAARPAQANGAAVAPNTDAMVDPSAPHTFRYVHLKVPGGED